MKSTISALAEARVVDLKAKAKDLRRDWYEIRNAAGEGGQAPQVYVYGEIGDSCWGDSVSASSFVREFAAIDSDRIELHVNSPGGDVWEGIAIANAIRGHRAHVVATVDAIAASAASFIATAADELVMARNSELMIHDAMGIVVGNAADMRDFVARLDTVSDNIASMYAEKAGGTVEEWRDVMRAETWYSAEEAVAAGLADSIDQKKSADTGRAAAARASFDLSSFTHPGRAAALAPKIRAHKPPATPAEPTTTPKESAVTDRFLSAVRERLGVQDANADEDTVLAALEETLGEQAEPTTIAPAPTAAALPEGFVAVDANVLKELREGAANGTQARAEQQAAERRRILDEAMGDGRVAKASEAKALELLELDDANGVTTYRDFLGTLPTNSAVPMAAAGHAGGLEAASDDQVDDVTQTTVYKNWSM